jgi:NitT/TauT family transport system substrate-binding protein
MIVFPRRLASFLAVALLALGAKAEPETVTYATPGSVSYSAAPYAFAEQAGFFKDENLKLDVVVMHGSGEIIPQILRGDVLTSTLTPDLVIVSRQPGRPNFPIHFAYNVYRHSIWQMAVLDSSPIHSFKDLAGKTIGVVALTSANVLQTKALLRRSGVDPASVTFVAVGNGGPALETLRNGRIDALNLFAYTNATLETLGVKIRRLDYPPEFAETSSHGLAFSDQMIAQHPDRIARFGRALAEGTVACQANPDGCLDAYWATFPAQKPHDLTDAMREQQRLILKAVIDNMVAGPKKFGEYDDADWKVSIDSLKAGGELKDGDIPLASLYTNQFVEAYNHFDRDAVIARAKAWHP